MQFGDCDGAMFLKIFGGLTTEIYEEVGRTAFRAAP